MSLQQAIQFIKSGDKELGRQKLAHILKSDPSNATAWIWLSACYEDVEMRKKCLEAALKADPQNDIACTGLERLKSTKVLQSSESPAPSVSAEAKTSSHNSGIEVVAEIERTEPEYTSFAWICPKCNSHNMASIVLRIPTTLRCPHCSQEYECLNGEAVWGQCNVDSAVWSQWFNWIVRLQQADGSIVEVGFTLHTPDFTIAGGDFLAVFMKRGWIGQYTVVEVENKTTGNVIKPGK